MPPRAVHSSSSSGGGLPLAAPSQEAATAEQQRVQNDDFKADCLAQRQGSSGDDYVATTIVWRNVALMAALHLAALVGVKRCACDARAETVALGALLYALSGLGITAGAHRLWAHRSYKARLALRVFLCALNTLAFQNSILEWSRDHRSHHKFAETNADPHNVKRGFFFAHVGWLLVRKHPDVVAKGRQIDLSDLRTDCVVNFQHKHYLKLVTLACFVLPTAVPVLAWQESVSNAFLICVVLRYVVTLNNTWLVNSAAHTWGRQPYDATLHTASRENRLVSLGALGEGFHNFHHTFPWHYAASELGYDLNATKLFIDAMAFVGLAYERRVVPAKVINARKLRTGDCHMRGWYGKH